MAALPVDVLREAFALYAGAEGVVTNGTAWLMSARCWASRETGA